MGKKQDELRGWVGKPTHITFAIALRVEQLSVQEAWGCTLSWKQGEREWRMGKMKGEHLVLQGAVIVVVRRRERLLHRLSHAPNKDGTLTFHLYLTTLGRHEVGHHWPSLFTFTHLIVLYNHF